MKRTIVVFVHGWAMNAAVWESLSSHLPAWVDAVFVDLPGHGNMHGHNLESLDQAVRAVAAASQHPAVWVGWSLGGLLCQRLARDYAERVKGLLLAASTPCFMQQDGWPHAMQEDVFAQFSSMLSEDIGKTIKRFLALQMMGSNNARAVMVELEQAIAERGLPDAVSLQNALAILHDADLRQDLVTLQCPVNWFLGERDMLVPAALGAELQSLRPQDKIIIQRDAGHAGFVSHPQAFVSALTDLVSAIDLQEEQTGV